jgi:hypothetical protein
MAHPIPSLEITIRTGDDDPRGDSIATAYLIVSHGGSTGQYSTILKKKSSWSNNSSHGAHYLKYPEFSAQRLQQERPTFWHRPAIPRRRL